MARIDKAAMPPARSCKPRKLTRGRPQLHAGLIPLIHAEQEYIYFTAGVNSVRNRVVGHFPKIPFIGS